MLKYITKAKIKRYIINTCILLLILSGIVNIISTFPDKFKMLYLLGEHYKVLRLQTITIHRDLTVLNAFILIFLSFRLYKRMKVAWMIVITMIPVAIVLKIIKYHSFTKTSILLEIFILIVLLINYRDFDKESDPINFKKGIAIASISLFLVIINSAIDIFLLKSEYKNVISFYDAFIKSIQLLFYMDKSVVEPHTRIGKLYVESIITINWVCIIISISLLLKPLIYQKVISNRDRQRVRELLNKYGKNPISYVAIEKDKKYYFSNNTDGVIAYVISNGVAVCAADPICNSENILILLSEFVTYCRQNDLNICFCQTSEDYCYEFRKMGFGIVKYGEEAMFKLDEYSIAGKKAAKVRQAINNANRLNIQVSEYKILEKRDYDIEKEIMEVSKEWLSIKKSGELSFMLGSIGLDNPMDKRYFVAFDENKKMLGFIVFVPFNGGKGYYADVTRRRKDAPIGIMEKIIINSFEIMKAEGVEYGSLGLAPLANVVEGDEKKPVVAKLLDFIYERLNQFYGFKTLHQYKKKYGPTSWESKYLVYYPPVFTPKIAYGILKATNPKGAKDYIFTQIKNLYLNNK